MPTSDWAATVADVGNILRARTKDRSGNEVGTFNSDTIPTGDATSATLNRATADVASVVGSDIPSTLWGDAANVVAYRAAMMIELTYFPEQIGSGRSPYNELRDLYKELLGNLRVAINAAGQDTPGSGESGSGVTKPEFDFPLGDPYLLGRSTRW